MPLPFPNLPASGPVEPKPGELWLNHRLTGVPCCALVASPRAAGDLSDHKLVLGPSGSGRTLLLARLGKVAHTAGRTVVFIEQSARGGTSPLRQVTERLDGSAVDLSTGAGFNPFWVPGPGPTGWAVPEGNIVEQLFHLLVALFDFETPEATRPKLRLRVLGYLLRGYYEKWTHPDAYWSPARDFWHGRSGHPDQQWHEGPSFNSFYEFMMLEAGRNRTPDFEEAYTWLLATSRKYYAGNTYDYLLNALPARQSEMLSNPVRAYYFGWPATTPSPAVTRAYWVLLYSLDTYLSAGSVYYDGQRLSVITNGLPSGYVEETQLDMTYIHLHTWRSFNRELVVGSAHLPVWSLLSDLTTKLLLPGCLREPAAALELGLSAELAAQVQQMSPQKREVALLVGQRFTIYSALLAPAHLALYQPQWL